MIYLDYNNMTNAEATQASSAILEGQISTKGKYVEQFESLMAGYLGMPYVLATNSGTAALHVALLLHNPESRSGLHKITIPDITFVATRNMALACGITVDVQDVDPKTWLLPRQPLKKVSIPVHLYGIAPESNPGDVHDAAEAFGNYPGSGRRVPMLDRLTIYSFNGNKTMTTSGGGLLVCRNKEQHDRAMKLITPGLDNDVVSYNYRMTSLAAAVGIAQFGRLPELIDRKRKIYEIYRNELPKLTFQEGSGIRWMTACLFDRPAGGIQDTLTKHSIPTRRIFKPMMGLPVAQRIYDYGLCLPSSTLNRDEDIQWACEMIKRVL